MLPKKNRYVKLNMVDYLLIFVLVLLVLALLVRGVSFLQARNQTPAYAKVEFVIQDLSEKNALFLLQETRPFFLQDGSTFAAAFDPPTMQQMTKYVLGKDGQPVETEVPDSYEITITFVAEGGIAKDGAFLHENVRRLAKNETLYVTQANVTYLIHVKTVELLGGT